MNKVIGIGIGVVIVAIAAVFAFSSSTPEIQPQDQSQLPEDSVAVQDEATVNVQVGVTEPGEKISIKVEENLGVKDKTP